MNPTCRAGGTVRYRYVEGDYSGGNRDPHAEFDQFIAKVRADTLREFAAKDIPAAVEARRTLLAEADEIEREARDGE